MLSCRWPENFVDIRDHLALSMLKNRLVPFRSARFVKRRLKINNDKSTKQSKQLSGLRYHILFVSIMINY